jgi:hypothetical protein
MLASSSAWSLGDDSGKGVGTSATLEFRMTMRRKLCRKAEDVDDCDDCDCDCAKMDLQIFQVSFFLRVFFRASYLFMRQRSDVYS